MRPTITASAIALFAVGCATFQPGAPEGEVDVIAHRGASAYAPENTLAAFTAALEMNAHWFELDCTLTKDNDVVVIHDDTLARTTGGIPGAVADYTLAELGRYDVGSWFNPEYAAERIPTLGQALDLAHGRIGVYVEIKNSADDKALMNALLTQYKDAAHALPDHAADILDRIEHSGTRNLALTRNVIDDIRQRGMENSVVIQSFSPIVCAVALIEAPEIRTEILASSSDNDPLQWERYRQWTRLLQPAGMNVNKNDVTETLVDDLHNRGLSIAVWTVNDVEHIRRFKRWGVDAIITDRPDVALRILDT